MIAASAEVFNRPISPFIENRALSLQSRKIVLAAAERVTSTFSDGLIQFTIDGDLKEALIENYGKIEAANDRRALNADCKRRH
jgi:hypothetical protein